MVSRDGEEVGEKKGPGEGKTKRSVDGRKRKTGALGLVRVNLGILANPPLALVPLCCCLPTPTVLIKTHRGKEKRIVSQDWK